MGVSSYKTRGKWRLIHLPYKKYKLVYFAKKWACGVYINTTSDYLRKIQLNKIDLSIIIVNYRSWEVLAECIKSFNKYKPSTSYEIIVVDNDSQDGKFNAFKK